jgi:aspartyl protease family protein
LAALLWFGLIGVFYLLFADHQAPKVATPAGTAAEVAIERSRDGHYYVAGAINGQAVTFMVDTGASVVAVSRTVAERIGLPRGRAVVIGTAGGQALGEELTEQTISIGRITVHRARIMVLERMSNEALLGQNVLRHLEVVQAEGRMTLRAKPAAE